MRISYSTLLITGLCISCNKTEIPNNRLEYLTTTYELTKSNLLKFEELAESISDTIQWKEVAEVYSKVEPFLYGPLKDNFYGFTIARYPVDTSKVSQNLANQTFNNSGSNGTGLYALEYILFSQLEGNTTQIKTLIAEQSKLMRLDWEAYQNEFTRLSSGRGSRHR